MAHCSLSGGARSGFAIRRLAIAHGDQLDPSGIVINTGPFEHIGFAIFAIEAAGALVRPGRKFALPLGLHFVYA